IRARLGQVDLADQSAIGRVAMHAVEAGAAPAGGRPQVAVAIGPDTIRITGTHLYKDATVTQAPILDVEDADVGGRAGIDDIDQPLVGREAQPGRPVEVGGHHGRLAAARVEPVDIARQLEGRLVPFIVHQNAIARIGEPDRPVGVDYDIVRRVKALAVESIHQHRDPPVVLSARHPPRAVLATDQPPLVIAGVAIAVVGRRAEDRHRAGLLAPAQDAVVRDIREEQKAAIAEPDRPLGPARTGPQPLDCGAAEAVLVEARIDRFDRRIGVAHDRAILAPGLRARAWACHCYAPSLLGLTQLAFWRGRGGRWPPRTSFFYPPVAAKPPQVGRKRKGFFGGQSPPNLPTA